VKTILLMRHAKSSWDDDGLDDHDRPLKKRGLRAAPRMGRLLDERGLVPDLIVCSSAVRAVQTARLVAGACGYAGPIREDPTLYLAAAERYLAVLRGLRADVARPLLIGHNPGLEQLIRQLTAVDLHLPTAAIACVTASDGPWGALDLDARAHLDEVWKPKALDD